MNELTIAQIQQERQNGKIIMSLRILESEISRIHRMGFPTTDDETISKWAQISLEQMKQLREICFMLNLDNIVYDVASDEQTESFTEDAAEELLLRSVSERIEMILETYPYAFDIIKHAVPFELEDAKEISKSNSKDYYLIKKYAYKLYLMYESLHKVYVGE